VFSTSAFSPVGRDAVIDPLLGKMVGTNISSQPDPVATKAEINSLIDRLTSCTTAPCATTKGVVKAACASVLGSAAMLVQ